MAWLNKYISLIKKDSVAGIDVVILPDGSRKYHFVLLKKNKTNIDIVSEKTDIETCEALSDFIPKDLPAFISVNGKGIIHKKTESIEQTNDAGYLRHILPDTSLNDFYLQKNKVHGNNLFISITRKELINNIVQEFSENKIEVLGCSIGPFSIKTILKSIGDENIVYDLFFSSHHFTISKNEFLEYSANNTYSSESIKIGDRLMSPQLLIPFSLGVNYFLGTNAECQIKSETIENTAMEYGGKRMFNIWAPALAVLFVLLFSVSIYIKQSLQTKKKNFDFIVKQNEPQLKKYYELFAEYKDKQLFLEQNGLLQTSKASYYINKLVKDTPERIQLNELDFFPAKKKTASDTAIAYNDKTIVINGACDHSTSLNEWMKVIEKKDFVQEVAIEDYKQEKNNTQGFFTLRIKMK